MSSNEHSRELLADAIVDSCVKDAEGLFDNDSLDSLRTCVRVSLEFRVFLELLPSDRYPDSMSTSTMDAIHLVRSGADCFFDLFYLNRIVMNSRCRQLTMEKVVTFDSFKKAYLSVCAELESPAATLQGRLSCLLDLGKLQSVFVGLTLR